MTVSMHDFCVLGPARIIDNLIAIIDKAAAHCVAHRIDPATIVNFRFAPDMYPFAVQIHLLTKLSTSLVARLTDSAVPDYGDQDLTFDELKARLAKARDHLRNFTPGQLAGTEDKAISIRLGDGHELKFTGLQYASEWGLPNLYFHATTAYNILRHLGVDVGKLDYLGAASR